MNLASAGSPAGSNVLSVACIGKGGCSYLRALATIEKLAGFEHTARSYARAAARCQAEGCWAERTAAMTGPEAAAPITLKVVARGTGARLCSEHLAETIPLTRHIGQEAVSDAAGNYVARRALKLESLAEGDDALGSLFRYWRQLRVATECMLSNIDTVQLERAGIIGKLHIVDVSSGDPECFRFELFGYAVPLSRFEMLRAVPNALYARSTMKDYNNARLAAAPRLDRLRSRIDGVSYHYTRLILPFVDAGDTVDRLLVGIRQEPGDGMKLEPRE